VQIAPVLIRTTAPCYSRQHVKVAPSRTRLLKHAAMLPATRRKSRGRKSLYKPEYCELVEMWGKQGKSRSEMCSLLNVGRATMAQWEIDYPDFGQAYARAREHAQAWWESKAQTSLGRRHFQAQLWRYSMAGRFKEDYAEQRQSGDGAAFDLNAFVSAIATGVAKSAQQPGDDAKIVEADASTSPACDTQGRGRDESPSKRWIIFGR